MKRACVLSNGCPESMIDSARVRLYLEENGWYPVEDPTDADVILLYSCALTKGAVNSSINIIKELQKKTGSESRLIVWGCLPKIEPDALKKVYVGPTFCENDLYRLDEIVNAVKPIDEITANQVFNDCREYTRKLRNNGREQAKLAKLRYRYLNYKIIYILPLELINRYYRYLSKKINLHQPKNNSVFYIKISTGCLGRCTYCAIPLSRGKIKSKTIDQIINEFRNGLSRGYKTFALLGTDSGSYGRDLGYTLVDLLREMVKEKGNYKIGLRNLNPHFLNQMLKDLEPLFSTGKIWYTEIPLESGSDRILKLMARNYTVNTFRESILRLRSVCPSLIIRTQVMVGFPTETKQDFAESIRLLKELKFDYIEVYNYSPRIGTPAETMQGRISERTALIRRYRIAIQTILDGMLKFVRNPHYRKLIRI